jgi:hypothetical protein
MLTVTADAVAIADYIEAIHASRLTVLMRPGNATSCAAIIWWCWGILARLPDPSMSRRPQQPDRSGGDEIPSNKMGFSQPIEMRLNELIAGEPTV